MVDILKDTIEQPGRTGSKAVGTSVVQFGHTQELFSGVTIKAASTNSDKIYVGYVADVTADSAEATDGFELSAGESQGFPVLSLDKIFVVAGAAAQKFFWTAQ